MAVGVEFLDGAAEFGTEGLVYALDFAESSQRLPTR
jgi:hypothetical protein